MSPVFARTVLAVTAVFFGVFFVWPIVRILQGGFVDPDGRFTFDYVAALLADPVYVGALANSLLIACATTLLALVIAVPLAVLNERYQFPGRKWFASLVIVPLILPPFVGAIGLRQIFGQYGAFNALLIALGVQPEGWAFDWLAANRFLGVVLVQAMSLFPIILLNASAALSGLDPALDESAQNLGCTGWRRFFRITLPLIRPALFAGGTIVFVWSFTELGTPLVFDYAQVTSVQIYSGLKDLGANPFPFALVAVMLATSLTAYGAGRGIFGRRHRGASAAAGRGLVARRLPLLPGIACTALFGAVTLVAILPHLAVVLVAFSREWHGSVVPRTYTLENFALALGHDLAVGSIANSLKLASLSTLLDLVLGTAIAYVIVRSKSKLRHLLDGLVMLPLAVPGIVLAFGYLAMSRPGEWFAFLDPVRDPTLLLVVAYSIRRLPYVVRSAAAGFEQTSETLEEAARSLGSPPLKATVRVTLPLITAHVIAGGLLVFAFSMLEVSDSLVLAQKQAFYPITKAVVELLQLLGDGRFVASALGAWAMAFLGLAVATAGVLLARRLGSLFRL